MTWIALRVDAGRRRQAVIETLLAGGAGAVQEDGETLVTHFEGERAAQAQADSVRRLVPGAVCTLEAVTETDWSSAWRATRVPVTVGTLTIAPPWMAGGLPVDRTVVIDAGMAFGTADHASTRGPLRLLQRVEPPARHVADCGAGTGVLSIAAAKLGAERVYAIELDPEALGDATANIERNGVASRVHLLEGDAHIVLPLIAPVELVIANILSSVIVTLLVAMARSLRPTGSAIVAGVQADERDALCARLARDGWRSLDEDLEDGWWSARIART